MDFNLNLISGLLFILHLVASFFMVSVIRKQLKLFKKRIYPELRAFRSTLFFLSVSIFFGNLVPMTIDFINAIGITSNDVPLSRILYISANGIVTLVSAVLVWSIYRYSAKTIVIVEEHEQEESKS